MSFTSNTAGLTPYAKKTVLSENYIDFTSADANSANWAQQYIPEVYEAEVERYGNRTIGGFLKMVGAEIPMTSDQVVWSEQGRIHIAYTGAVGTDVSAGLITFSEAHNINVADTIIVNKGGVTLKCYVTATPAATTINAIPYTAADISGLGADGVTGLNVFVYGSEYKKGSANVGNSKDADFTTFTNKPIILRDKYSVNGSDTASIGWVEVTTEAGTGGYLWYLKSEHEARLRFEDQLEMAMIEAEPVSSSQLDTALASTGNHGSQGLFSAIEERGLIYNNPDFGSVAAGEGLAEFDVVLQELDKQGAIE